MTPIAYLVLVIAYLLGSISSAIIFCKLAGLPDPREYGSKNPGATNVLRIGGKLSAVGVLLFDMLKGLLPTAIAFKLGLQPSEIGFIALAACLGHVFPLFFKFKGGKGVATALGTLLPFGIEIFGLAVGTWVTVFLISRYSSLSSVISALVLPIFVWYFQPEFTFPIALICCLLIYRHHDNLQRLWRGQENKFSFR
ncbi:putative glycerol-3-phosphate acyltransferase PlsY [Actinobacillus minor 202]|uniref:Glycerol-3-phosphate acyltransferase n=2 Tax=Actinobacillus TaxID=713 RepID=A0A2U8FLJ3_9PAST|nr:MULTISPECIES: glycerol-3-phosphate 1-O-acyltransferase PlsY [Actinobacillus]ACI28445.1 putative glycerol-3-phosphate acyltransferase PlsY [Actinobacillus minor 202]AWI51911.1 glycerol-3-phosphate 1-O-acyltransferase PlsY [Actinobacillus porcitonsillarum]